jgi:hypothetical protein
MFDPFACANSIRENLLSYIASSLPVGNQSSQTKLGEAFFSQWELHLFKGPFVEALPRYETVSSLSNRYEDLVRRAAPLSAFWTVMSGAAKLSWRQIDSKSGNFLGARNRLWSTYPQEAEAERAQTSLHQLWHQKLYSHQWDALRTVSDLRRSIIVATGTGSGKTECYLLPLLHLLINESSSQRVAPGVRAIILFPMNALVEDQMRRLRKLLFWINLASLSEPASSGSHLQRPITFGRYTGDTPVDDVDPDRDRPKDNIVELGELVTRSQMRRTPPDILVTNFSMLEYALLRSNDQELFKNPRAFKMLVLDEVHSYSGTLGTEVAMLLRRLTAHLSERAGAPMVPPIFVGTSATVGSGPGAGNAMAEFASKLFACKFEASQILLGKTRAIDSAPDAPGAEGPRDLARGLSRFVKRRPLLLRLIARQFRVDDEPGWEARVAGDLQDVALLLHGFWEGIDSEIGDMDALSHDPDQRCREILGTIVKNSPTAHQLIDLIQKSEGGCQALDQLSINFFGTDELSNDYAQTAQEALSLLLTLVANATSKGRAVFPVRFHHFVTENREGLLCLNADCPGPAMVHSETDGWWGNLFIQHTKSCPFCRSIVYPLVLCRKCGFAYLEAWRLPSGICLPEKDDLEARGLRFLFRPVSGLSYTTEDLDAKKRALCLTCGCWFESTTENGKTAEANHLARCPNSRIIETFEWSQIGEDYAMSECAVCEQKWYADHEVVTAPTISPFAAATMFIEDLVSSSSSEQHRSKLISFSDTRQQAAKLARNLQRTNRDYVFRQMIYLLLATASQPRTTLELFQELYREIRDDDRKRQLLIDSPESIHDDLILEHNLADLMFREVTSAYHTLETLGLVRIDYTARITALAEGLKIPGVWDRDLSTTLKKDLVTLVLDWGFRFRHCVGSAGNKIPVNEAALQRWKIFIKRVPGPQFEKKSQREAVLFLEKSESRNPLFNFMSRLRQRNKSRIYPGTCDPNEFNELIGAIWRSIFSDSALLTIGRTNSECDREFLVARPTEPDFGSLQLNLNSLTWSAARPSDKAFQCNVCGRLSHYAVAGVCPVRKCQGELRETIHGDLEKRFSPAAHYRRLIQKREIRALRIEEHTAEIANQRRLEIERQFRGDEETSIDVISGSTTFELGVDLGSINNVFLANLPPRVSNYRQRAGRAGRREGMVPFVLSYVRERPHDQYFWRDLNSFISGPIPTPKFKLASEEVLRRHGFSVILSSAFDEYQKAAQPAGRLWGPVWKNFEAFLFAPATRASLQKSASNAAGSIAVALRAIYTDIEEGVRSKLVPASVFEALYKRIADVQRVLSARGDEGSIKVLGDYGILPTYAFPIYVDELRLNEIAPDRPPRCDLKLTRDRRISLVEYHPGRTIVAGKSQIRSKGIWAGFGEKPFKRCTGADCGEVFFNLNALSQCSRCGSPCSALTAVIPWGGFFGCVLGEGVPPEVDYDEISSSEVVFDPASDPRPEFSPSGYHLSVAKVDANFMQTARMRQFSPRPGSRNPLMLERRNDIKDVATPHTSQTCLALPTALPSSTSRAYLLLHEFPTDIIRLRILPSTEGRLIQSSRTLAEALGDPELSPQRRLWIQHSFWLTFGEALLIASGRFLDIDEVGNAELGISFRNETTDPCLDHRELILFDTAPGGAGYSREIANNLREVFSIAAKILGQCGCGDSCYRCLRSYRNQWIHSRLDRRLLSEGLTRFVEINWR